LKDNSRTKGLASEPTPCKSKPPQFYQIVSFAWSTHS